MNPPIFVILPVPSGVRAALGAQHLFCDNDKTGSNLGISESVLNRLLLSTLNEDMNQRLIPPSPGPQSTLSPGTRFGTYEILRRIGAGGMGEVYHGRDTRLGREVAIKTVSLERRSDIESLQRFEQEARSASALNHPNIVTIYELGEVDRTCYIAMEFVEGETLRGLLASGPLPLRKVVHIAAQLADALAKAHEAGVVHRDLKPENLMLSTDGLVKILDFGLSKLVAPHGRDSSETSTFVGACTEPGTILGTTGYMSPEQANGAQADFLSDQFSFGSVVYELLTGKPAFPGRTRAEVLAAILRDEPERIGSMNPQAPAPVIWILDRCLAKDPNDRYASTRDLARDLAAVRDRMAETCAVRAEPRATSLPVQRTPFVGRDVEVAALRQLLHRDEVRLVTLTGPGGIGKTRLALHVAGELAGHFAAGICFVPLSAVSDAGLIASAIAQAVGVQATGAQSPHESLKEYLLGLRQPMLLLLDNFEHLVSAAPLVAELLSIGPKLKVLVTSQAPLHVYGEHEFPVPSLGLPDPKSIPTLDALSQLPAVALFVERAVAVKRDFKLTRENASAVATICARLDGLPLAIELAAARIKLLSPSAMQARLERCLNLLTGGARDLPARQQTLRGTIDWSYGLLNAAEQKLFRRLSVFVGGCTLEGVEAVCDAKGDLGVDVLDGMASMVDKSLVQQVDHFEGESRFVMLATIREYARERLAASGDEATARRAHAAYCLVLAEEGAEPDGAQQQWLERLDLEHDNFRAALDWLIANGDSDWGLRLGAALFRFWETRELLSEGRDRLGTLLKLDRAAPHTKLRARVAFAAGVLAGEQGDYFASQHLMEGSLEISRALEDKHGIAVALNALAVNARDRGDLTAARSLFEQSLAMWREFGDPVAVARALSNLANVVKLQGEFARARSLYHECLGIFQNLEDATGVAWSLNYLGDVASEQTDFAAALALYEQSLAAFRQLGDGWGVASSLSDLGNLSREQSDYAESQRLYAESIRTFCQLGHKRGIARVLECVAVSAAAQSDAPYALLMAGAAASLRQRLGAPLPAAEQAKLETALNPARQALHASGLKAWMEGWAMPLEEVIEKALKGNTQQSPGNRTSA
jgi:predicted ATPase/serine/threonine protein kinase